MAYSLLTWIWIIPLLITIPITPEFTLSVSLPSQHHLQDHFFPYYYYLCHVLSFWSPSFAYQTLRPSPPASKLPFLLVHFTFLRMVPSHLLFSQHARSWKKNPLLHLLQGFFCLPVWVLEIATECPVFKLCFPYRIAVTLSNDIILHCMLYSVEWLPNHSLFPIHLFTVIGTRCRHFS